MELSRLTRDGTAEPISRDQILRRERGQANRYGKTAHRNLQHRNKCVHLLLCAREDPKKILCSRFLTTVVVHKKQTGVAELRPSLSHLRPSMPHRSRFLNNWNICLYNSFRFRQTLWSVNAHTVAELISQLLSRLSNRYDTPINAEEGLLLWYLSSIQTRKLPTETVSSQRCRIRYASHLLVHRTQTDFDEKGTWKNTIQ